MTNPVREKALKFGADTTLIGILSEPPRGMLVIDQPAIVLLNAGLLHRVGAARLHVRLARRLAIMGLRAVRFDFSGVGDSDARRDSLAFEESSVLEVQEVMNLLERTKDVHRFVLMGLCSGADVGFNAAQTDDRVIGVVQLDPYAYRTPGYYLRHYGKRLLEFEVWKRFIGIRVRNALGSRDNDKSINTDDAELVVNPYAREFPPKNEVAVGLERLVDREVCLLNIFSGGQDAYNYSRQYFHSFSQVDFHGRLDVDYLEAADHIFSGLAHQQFVLERVSRWMEQFTSNRTAGQGT